MRTAVAVVSLLVLSLAACKKKDALGTQEKAAVTPPPPPTPPTPRLPSPPARPSYQIDDVKRRLAKFAVVELSADLGALTDNERKALVHLRRAADEIDKIFWRQTAHGHEARTAEVRKIGGALAALYDVHYGPWDRLDEHHPFFGEKPRPKGAGFYPEDLAKKDLEEAIRAASPVEAKALQSPYTVIERRAGKLVAVPYAEAYGTELAAAATELEAAAALVPNATLAKFLRSRAKAFRTNDYFESEVDWMDVAESRLDVTIGPYEVYEDDLMGLKASFEAVIGVRDEASTKALSLFQQHLETIDRSLPMPDKYRSRRAAGSPIVVINKIYAGGDAKKAVQAIAFNLPNDEEVRKQKGSKKVMLKNVTEAKFEKILRPIAERLLDQAHAGEIDFETFFNEALMHELAHGMGPGILQRPSGEITVNQALKELYSSIEEAKADICGLFGVKALFDKGLLPKAREKFVYPSYLASMLRSVRFGAQEAHGRANVLQLNYLEAEGAIRYDEMAGRFGVDRAKMPGAVRKLAAELLQIEGEGDYEGAKAFLEKWGKAKPSLLAALKKLEGIPVDITPRYR